MCMAYYYRLSTCMLSKLKRSETQINQYFPLFDVFTCSILDTAFSNLNFWHEQIMLMICLPSHGKLMLPEKKTVKDPPRKTCSHKYGSFRPQTHHLTPPFPSSNPLPTTPCITNRMRGCGSSYMLARLGHASMSSSACMWGTRPSGIVCCCCPWWRGLPPGQPIDQTVAQRGVNGRRSSEMLLTRIQTLVLATFL